MTEWYYEENGRQRGPMAEADLAAMFANRFLPADARVSIEAFGGEWRPASHTQLVRSSGRHAAAAGAGAVTPAPPPVGSPQGRPGLRAALRRA